MVADGRREPQRTKQEERTGNTNRIELCQYFQVSKLKSRKDPLRVGCTAGWLDFFSQSRKPFISPRKP